jgi:hypothetical protein
MVLRLSYDKGVIRIERFFGTRRINGADFGVSSMAETLNRDGMTVGKMRVTTNICNGTSDGSRIVDNLDVALAALDAREIIQSEPFWATFIHGITGQELEDQYLLPGNPIRLQFISEAGVIDDALKTSFLLRDGDTLYRYTTYATEF